MGGAWLAGVGAVNDAGVGSRSRIAAARARSPSSVARRFASASLRSSAASVASASSPSLTRR
jgi:hypothetical protein